MTSNKSLVLTKYLPHNLPIVGEDLVIQTSTIDLNASPSGGLILKTNYISYDPYQRGRMRGLGGSYTGGFVLNTPLDNNAISTVLKSDHPNFKAGDVIIGRSNFSEYATVTKEDASKVGRFFHLENPLGLVPKLLLGALGMSGVTAYSSFYEIAKPKKGETIFISAASGAVGAIVGQLAKREGMKVMGSVGSDTKLAYIKEVLGFDAGFNYKKEKPVEALQRITQELGVDGLNVYYDNVGGEQLDAALEVLTLRGKIGEFIIF